jgi:hypothetical protein
MLVAYEGGDIEIERPVEPEYQEEREKEWLEGLNRCFPYSKSLTTWIARHPYGAVRPLTR